jgi:hypothetical protein
VIDRVMRLFAWAIQSIAAVVHDLLETPVESARERRETEELARWEDVPHD